MSIPNQHRITLRGDALPEIIRRATLLFEEFFDELSWEFESVTANADIVRLQNGAGVNVAEQISGWDVDFVAVVPALSVDMS